MPCHKVFRLRRNDNFKILYAFDSFLIPPDSLQAEFSLPLLPNKSGEGWILSKKHLSICLGKKETDGNEIKVFSFLELRPKKALSLQKPLLPVHTVPKEWSWLEASCILDQLSPWASLMLHADHKHIPHLSSALRDASRLWSLEAHVFQGTTYGYTRSCLCKLAFRTESQPQLESKLWTCVFPLKPMPLAQLGLFQQCPLTNSHRGPAPTVHGRPCWNNCLHLTLIN